MKIKDIPDDIFLVSSASEGQVLCLCLGYCSPTMPKSAVLGPQLILGVREYYARLMIDFDAGPNLSSIAFQESVHVSTGNNPATHLETFSIKEVRAFHMFRNEATPDKLGRQQPSVVQHGTFTNLEALRDEVTLVNVIGRCCARDA
ncbi:uncharacterized protein HD556DRAFT_1303898 [Suillus plorans]|uniref:Uncharacterized protein n=1 Tax=Suillus plorans TaxID=116603 RepID=A0A9P7J5Q3_9AGAM|nr:uncharacterized protein HD556DRAFT_1303898 [Suillus plorans]KAG1803919.1 hypothetical protein HD556DRAFT_1303898 [Suillus plorans]